MKAILAALALSMQELRAKANSALAGVGPVDSYEGAQEVSYALKTMKWVHSEIETMLASVADVQAKYDSTIADAAAALVDAKIAERIAAGELLNKVDHDLAIAAAELKGKDLAEAAFKLKEEAAANVAARRLEIVTAHGEEVAALVPAAVLEGEGFSGVAAELDRRVTELAKGGITASGKKEAFADIACAIPFDDAGKTAFDTRIVALKQLLGANFKPATIAASKPPLKVVPGSRAPVTVAASQQSDATEEKEDTVYAM